MHLVKLNLARNCLRYLIKAYGINEIFIPFYTCNTVWNTVRSENCTVKFYHIDRNFIPAEKFPQNAYILYTNYFGLCSGNCNDLAKKYNNLIVDNSHAFFSDTAGLASFNSLRKFFNVTNGAYLFTGKILPDTLVRDTLSLPAAMFGQDYEQFVRNELFLDTETNTKLISSEVETKMTTIDFQKEKDRRLMLFEKYRKIFYRDNLIKLLPEKNEVPYCYPFCPAPECAGYYSKIFQKHNIKLLKLWKDFPDKFAESRFNMTAALPLDDIETAEKIFKIF